MRGPLRWLSLSLALWPLPEHTLARGPGAALPESDQHCTIYSDVRVVAETGDKIGSELRVFVGLQRIGALLLVYEGGAEPFTAELTGSAEVQPIELRGTPPAGPAVAVVGCQTSKGFTGKVRFIFPKSVNEDSLALPRVASSPSQCAEVQKIWKKAK